MLANEIYLLNNARGKAIKINLIEDKKKDTMYYLSNEDIKNIFKSWNINEIKDIKLEDWSGRYVELNVPITIEELLVTLKTIKKL